MRLHNRLWLRARLAEILGPPGADTAVDRSKAESLGQAPKVCERGSEDVWEVRRPGFKGGGGDQWGVECAEFRHGVELGKYPRFLLHSFTEPRELPLQLRRVQRSLSSTRLGS